MIIDVQTLAAFLRNHGRKHYPSEKEQMDTNTGRRTREGWGVRYKICSEFCHVHPQQRTTRVTRVVLAVKCVNIGLCEDDLL